MNIVIISLAGLGLFLTGLHLLSQAMQAIAGRRARAMLARLTAGPLAAAGAGLALGVLTQSTSAATFACIGLLGAGALSLEGALTLTAWASVGTSLLVFLAALDVRLLGLYAMGGVGLSHLVNKGHHRTLEQITAICLALGILLIGLGFIKDVGLALRESPWASEFFIFSAETPAIALLAGALAAVLVQSSASVSVLAVTLNLAGVLPLREALLLVCGASVGSGLSVALVTSHMDGAPRQIALWQLAVKALGVVPMLPLLNWLSFGPEALSVRFGWPNSTLIAATYLGLQVAGASLGGLLQQPAIRWLKRLAPDNGALERFSPRLLHLEATRYPETATVLAERAQRQLFAELPSALDPLRPSEVKGELLTNDDRHAAAQALGARISEFIVDIAARREGDVLTEVLFALQHRSEHLHALQDSLHSFVSTLEKGPRAGLSLSLIESLHLALTLLSETALGVEDHAATLMALTADRGDLMDGIRRSLMAETSLDPRQRQELFAATGLFERCLWFIRQLSAPAAEDP